jgi:hypothetical protein
MRFVEPTMLTAYTGPIAAGVITPLGGVDPAHHEALLLLSGKLTLAKVVLLDHKGGIAVLAELPADHVDEQSLR